MESLTRTPRDLEREYLELGKQHGWWRQGTGHLYYCRRLLFGGIDLAGKRFLDIGCGNGRFCLWAAIRGAAEVVGLEPSVEGSRGGAAVRQFREFVARLRLDNVRIEEVTLQDFIQPGRTWDVVLLHAAVNHLDEPACIRLLEDEAARETYRGLFRKIRELMAPGGKLVIMDCARRNLFGDLGWRNPFVPTIEWHKHQQPKTWAALLLESGFREPRISWLTSGYSLALGRLARNRLWAYCTRSSFRLQVTAD
ncbi:MAG: hypothetical protein AMXMBFR83_14090 [Phycisphaerae bacterium]